jgi:[ribosomal protein S5]-alanine N-acetyltransferase
MWLSIVAPAKNVKGESRIALPVRMRAEQKTEADMNDHREIETERLVLRPLVPEHAEALHAIFADPKAMRFWQEPPHQDVARTRAMIAGLVSGSERAWALVPREGGDAIGLVYYLGNVGAPGMGYILGPDWWGKGLMAEAVRGALDYGFDTLGVDRVELWIDARNLASWRLAERVGFQRRAAFRQKYPHAATPHDTLVYGLHLEDWRPGTKARVPRPIHVYNLQPILGVKDVRATAEFYRDMLGFEISFLYGTPPTYAGVRLGEWTMSGANIHISSADPPPSPRGLALTLNVGAGIDALHAAYKGRGVDVLGEVVRQPWGSREFAIRDCNGYVLRFGAPD